MYEAPPSDRPESSEEFHYQPVSCLQLVRIIGCIVVTTALVCGAALLVLLAVLLLLF
jgi:hypothetical protein